METSTSLITGSVETALNGLASSLQATATDVLPIVLPVVGAVIGVAFIVKMVKKFF